MIYGEVADFDPFLRVTCSLKSKQKRGPVDRKFNIDEGKGIIIGALNTIPFVSLVSACFRFLDGKICDDMVNKGLP